MEIIFSDEDSDLRSCRWHICNRYAYRHKAGTHDGKEAAHRIVLERIIGRALRKGELPDHINRDRLDNRRFNLRITNVFGNGQNQFRGANRGTTFHKQSGKWQAQVGHFRRSIYVGLFDTREEAATAARTKRIELQFLGEA